MNDWRIHWDRIPIAIICLILGFACPNVLLAIAVVYLIYRLFNTAKSSSNGTPKGGDS